MLGSIMMISTARGAVVFSAICRVFCKHSAAGLILLVETDAPLLLQTLRHTRV